MVAAGLKASCFLLLMFLLNNTRWSYNEILSTRSHVYVYNFEILMKERFLFSMSIPYLNCRESCRMQWRRRLEQSIKLSGEAQISLSSQTISLILWLWLQFWQFWHLCLVISMVLVIVVLLFYFIYQRIINVCCRRVLKIYLFSKILS